MYSMELVEVLSLLASFFPCVLISHIDENGIIHTTNYRKISLRKFLDTPKGKRVNYLLSVLED